MKTIEQKIVDCMMGRSIIPEEYAELTKELKDKINSLIVLQAGFLERMKEESPFQVGDKVQLWGGGLLQENSYKIAIAYIREISVNADGSFHHKFWKAKVDGSQSMVKGYYYDYLEIERLEK